MNPDETKRLRRLLEDERKSASGYGSQLTLPDLILLLKGSAVLRGLIADIAATPRPAAAAHTSPMAVRHDAPNEEDDAADPFFSPPQPAVEAKPSGRFPWSAAPAPAPAPVLPPDALRSQLHAELALLARVKADAELAATWLGDTPATEGQDLVRLIACAAQWDTVLTLWDKLASRCKADQRPATAAEQAILVGGVTLHNLTWRDRQAALLTVEVGTPFDYEAHDRGTPQGQVVKNVWLPGLRNAAGQTQKKPIVGM